MTGWRRWRGSRRWRPVERSAGNLLPVPWVEVDDVANLVSFLASDRAQAYQSGRSSFWMRAPDRLRAAAWIPVDKKCAGFSPTAHAASSVVPSTFLLQKSWSDTMVPKRDNNEVVMPKVKKIINDPEKIVDEVPTASSQSRRGCSRARPVHAWCVAPNWTKARWGSSSEEDRAMSRCTART